VSLPAWLRSISANTFPPANAAPRSAPGGGSRRILVGLALGAVLGLVANRLAGGLWATGVAVSAADIVGNLFLRMLFVMVVPLVVSALALAVAEIGDLGKLGRLGLATLGVTAVLSSTAVVIGLGLVNLIRPGDAIAAAGGADPRAAPAAESDRLLAQARGAKPLREVLIDMIPQNPLQEMAGAIDGSSRGNGMLAVMVFALLLGAACAAHPAACRPILAWLEAWNVVAMTVIGWGMAIAPVGAGCLVFTTVARLGLDALLSLLWFALTVLLGLALQLVVVYPIVLRALSSFRPLDFFRRSAEALEVAFGTSSSNATLPTALRVAEHSLGLRRDAARFVLTVGATGNQNGTALFEGVVVLFLAQVFGVALTGGQQLQVVLMAMLAGIGTAGVPGGSLPLVAVIAQSVGVPAEGVGIVLGVDRLLDMCRTVLNVTGDLVVAACVAGREEPSAVGRHEPGHVETT
jgi:DAACS family dicarboxylate/amino acid:cation (Na+ or H+) symporter